MGTQPLSVSGASVLLAAKTQTLVCVICSPTFFALLLLFVVVCCRVVCYRCLLLLFVVHLCVRAGCRGVTSSRHMLRLCDT